MDDPNSSIRKEHLKNLLDQSVAIKASSLTQGPLKTINNITEYIKKANILCEKFDTKQQTDHPTEAVMGAEAVKNAHVLMNEVLQNQGSIEFSDEQFVNAIVRSINKNHEKNWDHIADIAANVARIVKFSPCLLGSFEHDPNEEEQVARTARTRRTRTNLEIERRPEDVTQLEEKDENYKKVNFVLKQIKALYKENNCKPISFHKLVLDPNCYMSTVHNVFQMTFLSKDSSISISEDDNGLAVVAPTTKEQRQANEHNGNSRQIVCMVTPQRWEQLVAKYNITEPYLKKN